MHQVSVALAGNTTSVNESALKLPQQRRDVVGRTGEVAAIDEARAVRRQLEPPGPQALAGAAVPGTGVQQQVGATIAIEIGPAHDRLPVGLRGRERVAAETQVRVAVGQRLAAKAGRAVEPHVHQCGTRGHRAQQIVASVPVDIRQPPRAVGGVARNACARPGLHGACEPGHGACQHAPLAVRPVDEQVATAIAVPVERHRQPRIHRRGAAIGGGAIAACAAEHVPPGVARPDEVLQAVAVHVERQRSRRPPRRCRSGRHGRRWRTAR